MANLEAASSGTTMGAAVAGTSAASRGTNRTIVGWGPSTEVQASLCILDFEKQMKRCKPGDKVCSNKFRIQDKVVRLKVYPNGLRSGRAVWVGLSYKRKEEFQLERVQVLLGGELVKDRREVEVKAHRGPCFRVTHAAARARLREGALELVVRVAVAGERRVMDASAAASQAGQENWVLASLYRQGLPGTDFALVCEGRALPCHKAVLRGASPYFLAMFENSYKETLEEGVELECSAAVGAGLLAFLYTGEVGGGLLTTHPDLFLRLADRLLVAPLKAAAEQEMLRQLARANMVECYLLADLHGANTLRAAAKELIKMNLDWLRQQEGWKARFRGQAELILELL